MKRILKRAMVVMLTAVMLLTAAPLSGFAGLDLPNLADLFTLKADAATKSGKCGDNLTWSLDTDTGVLTVSGTGDMYNWSSVSNVPWYSSRSSVKTVVIGDSVTSIGDYAFYSCTGLTSVTIGNSVTSIGNYAFYSCTGLTSVTIPDSVTSIVYGAFYNCTGLTSVTIGNSVTSIGYGAFYECTGLTSVTIGNSVTSIGNYAFYDCTGIKELTMPCSAKIYNSEDTFYKCTNIEKVTLTKGTGKMQDYSVVTNSSSSTTYYQYTPWFISRNSIKQVLIEDGVQNIGSYAFYDCTGLTSVTIPDSVTSIGGAAFYNCTSLTSITVKEGNPKYSSDEYGVLFNKDKTLLIQYPIGNTRTSYTIPDSVTSIGNRAFWGCTGLTSATIPDSVTSIDSYAFSDCTGLTSITIPNSVTSIGDYAFLGCTSLTSITVKEGNPKYSSDEYGVLFNKDKTMLIQYPIGNTRTSYTIPDSVTSIGERAFYSCTGLTSVTIPDSVTSIGGSAFRYCTGLTSVTIGNSVTGIDRYAFYNCYGLKELTMPCSAKIYNSEYTFYNCKNIEKVTLTKGTGTMQNYYPYGSSSSDSTYYQYTPWYISRNSIKEIVIEDGVQNIGRYAFFDCTGLTSITIPDSVTSIGDYAFERCTGLTSITIPDSVTSIGGSAFKNCNNIYLLVYKNSFAEQYAIDNSLNYRIISKIPDDTETLSGKVTNSFLWSIDKITETLTLDCNGTMVSFENDVAPWIQYEEYIKHIVINDGCTNISKNAFMLCSKVESVLIPNSVTNIDSYAFYGCSRLTGINIPVGVTSIGDYAFYYCTGLKELTIPCSAKIYNSECTFYNCKNIEKVTLTKGTGTMQNYGTSTNSSSSTTHYQYTPWYISRDSIKEIVIEDGVQNIGSYAFYGCIGLTKITIPDSVEEISYSAFNGCTGLTSVIIPDSVTSIGGYAFYGCTGLTSIVIPDSVTSIGNSVFYGCTGLTSIIIPDSVTSIGGSAFRGCTGLTSISIPDSVTSFGSNVLSGCTNLISIDIGNGVTKINESDFKNLTSLKSVTIGTGVTTIGDYAFNGCTGLEEMVIPYSVKSIGSAAFTGCTNLGSLTVYSRNCTFADDATAYYTTICGFTGSTAETYANEKGFDFVAIDDTHTHIYDNDCDSICNLCGAERTVGEHIFGDYTVTKEPTCTEQGEKARICAICNYKDTEAIPATGHTYDSDCDTDCNVCGAVRVPPHSDNDTNGICDNCGAYLSDIALSTVKDVVVSAGETVYLKFTAPYTGRYTFYSSSDLDTYGYICDSNKNSLVSDDDSGSNNNFLITTTLTQGTVYYLGVKYYSSSNSGTIPVTINYICDHTSTHTEHKDSTCTEHGYDKSICDICGATVSTTELPYKHDYVATVTDPTCTEQGYTTYTCSLCGDSCTADYTEPLNHPHKTWRVTKNPTAASTGLMTETCDLCGAKTGEMEIPMLIPNYVTGITVSPNRLALNVGETANLTAIITPDTAENKNVIWSSSDTDIATVADGVVTAKTPGVAVIIAKSEDGGYKDICVVRVASLTPVNGAVVDNENGLIYGIASNSADINSYVNTVDDTMTVECDSALLGTGSVVNIVKDDVIVDSYKIVLFGDVNGDGWYDGMDAVTVSCIANGMLTKDQIGEAAYMAADCNHDGVVDEFDVALLNQAGVLLANVDQTKTQEELAADSDYAEYLNLIDQNPTVEEEPKKPEQDNGFIAKLIAFIETILKYIVTLVNKIW